MASSAMGLKLGVFGFLPTTHAKTNAKQMRERSSRAVRRFTRVYLHAADRSRCRWHTHLTNHGYFDNGKNPKTPNLSPMPGLKWRRFWDLLCISVAIVQKYGTKNARQMEPYCTAGDNYHWMEQITNVTWHSMNQSRNEDLFSYYIIQAIVQRSECWKFRPDIFSNELDGIPRQNTFQTLFRLLQ